MKDLKGTKTEQNLWVAFGGESMARNKYSFFASKAKKDGYVQISKIFEETAANEKEHAELWYKYLHGGSISDTAANLLDAAEGENAEGEIVPSPDEATTNEGVDEGISDAPATDIATNPGEPEPVEEPIPEEQIIEEIPQ